MKKLIAASLASLSLVGCNSDSDITKTEVMETRVVDVALQTVHIKEPVMSAIGLMYSVQADSSNYTHKLKVDEYKLCVTDQLNKEQCTNINDITLPFNTTYTVTGSAVFTVSSTATDSCSLCEAYTLSGTQGITNNESSVIVILENTEWAFVTLDHIQGVIDSYRAPTINGITMDFKYDRDIPFEYWFMYVNKTTQSASMHINLMSGSTTTATLPSPMVENKHYAYEVSNGDEHNTSIGFTIIDKWEEPETICIGNACAVRF